MDVTGTTLVETHEIQWLVPLLFCTYCIQFVMGLWTLYFTIRSDYYQKIVTFELFSGGITWMAIAIGNGMTLNKVYERQLADSEKRKKIKFEET